MFIYGLFDPRNGELRYVGKTNNMRARFRGHRYEIKRSNSHKSNWVKSLKEQNLEPKIEELDNVPDSEWQFWEQWYIAYFRGMGCNLTNISDGGDNPPINKDKHRTDKIKGWNKGMKWSQESKRRMSQARIGKIPVNKGVPMSEEQKIKVSNSKSLLNEQQRKDVLNKYCNENMSIKELAESYHCKICVIYKIVSPFLKSKSNPKPPLNKEHIIENYFSKQLTSKELAKLYCRSLDAIYAIVKPLRKNYPKVHGNSKH
jgi:predicted DNA-binding protein YlxM (UPF0122 family)